MNLDERNICFNIGGGGGGGIEYSPAQQQKMDDDAARQKQLDDQLIASNEQAALTQTNLDQTQLLNQIEKSRLQKLVSDSKAVRARGSRTSTAASDGSSPFKYGTGLKIPTGT